MKKLFLFCCVLSLICPLTDIGQEKVEGCTIGVASGEATADGRPLLWKNRDTSSKDNEVVYRKDGRFKYLALTNAGWPQGPYAGVNELGFCMITANAFNLPDKSEEGMGGEGIMRLALQQCMTVDDFENILEQTNVSGRTTVFNIGVIDAFGGAAIFETGNFSYTRFDATDPKVAPQGYIIRTTFAFTGGEDSGRTKSRYDCANQLWRQAVEKGQLDYRYVLRKVCRDLSGAEKVSYTPPEMEATEDNTLQVLNNKDAISRPGTAAVALFHGVRPDENPSLTTFWSIMGGPIFSVAVPSWVIAESTAPELDGEEFSPLCTVAYDLYLSNYIMADKRTFLLNPEMLPDIWAVTYPTEDRIFDQTESIMTQWRQDYPAARQVASFHRSMASEAMNTLQEVTGMLIQKGEPTASLRIALHMRDLEKAKAFIKQGININVSDGHGYTPLHYAVQNNQKKIVQLLISKNADVNAKNRSGQTPLDIAVDRNRKEIIELLQAKDAEVSSIFVAASMGDLAKVKAFLEEGIDVNTKDEQGMTLLHLAAQRSHKDIVELLLGKGADVNAKNEKNETPLDIALRRKRQSDTVKLLFAKGGEVSTIHSAALIGNLEKVRSIIEAGSNVNAKDVWGRTVLHCAAIEGHKDIVELLLEKGADVNAGAYYNRTAVEFAMQGNHTKVVDLLISKGADISLLHLAISMKDEAKARSLIESGADVNNRTPDGTTPLNRAITEGLKDITELLIACGANVNAGHYWGWTPLHGAAEEGHKDMVVLLIASGANVNAKDGGGRAPLWYAKTEGHTEIIQLLRKHGAEE